LVAIEPTDLLFTPIHIGDIFNVSLDSPRPERDHYGMTEEKQPIRGEQVAGRKKVVGSSEFGEKNMYRRVPTL